MYPNLDFWFENKPSGNPAQVLATEKWTAEQADSNGGGAKN
jgi:hypothetical protein